MHFQNKESVSEERESEWTMKPKHMREFRTLLVLPVTSAVDEFSVKLRPLATFVWRTLDVLWRAAISVVVFYRIHFCQLVAKFFRHSVRNSTWRVVRFAVLAVDGNDVGPEASGTFLRAAVRGPEQTAAVHVVGNFPRSVPDPRGTVFNVFQPMKSLCELTVLHPFVPLVPGSFLLQSSLQHEFIPFIIFESGEKQYTCN